jgi:hypothetical protein
LIYATTPILGSGGGMMEDVKKINLHFWSKGNCSLNEARILFVGKAELLLSMVNCDEKLRPYLHTFPFTTENIEFSITFYELFPSQRSNDIYMVFLSRGKIVYTKYDFKKNEHVTFFNESYSEALNNVISGLQPK